MGIGPDVRRVESEVGVPFLDENIKMWRILRINSRACHLRGNFSQLDIVAGRET